MPSDRNPPPSEGFIPPHGGYKKLLSYQKPEIVFDATVRFCERYFTKSDRTHDQMVQAARSGKQNIAEASVASGTSKEMEIKLTNVARASLEELLIDYRDFLRSRGFVEWTSEHADMAIRANVIIGLIKVACYLLDQQIKKLEKDFLREGGSRERMTRARLKSRGKDQRD